VKIAVDEATEADAAAVALVRSRAAEELTRLYGRGQWSWLSTEQAALRDVQTSRVLVARDDGVVVGTLKLQTQKPWAIDAAYFTPVRRPLYLLDMAVDPVVQRRGVGRALLEAAGDVASAWPAEAIRLDAYDAAAGAGEFYEKCGYREVGRATYRDSPLIYFERLLVEK
jgi:ribosomal protein S18 acetylase RimI-like enzyme